MPIRTNRGRAAVYRKLWGWPLRSPRHLAATVVGLVVLATGIGLMLPHLGLPAGAQDGGAAQPVGTTTQPLPQAAQPGVPTFTTAPRAPRQETSVSLPTPPPAAPAPEALQVARQWGQAWVTHPEDMTAEQWLQQLAPFTTDEYLVVMRTVDPRNVPATQLVGEVRAVSATTRSVQVDLPTDAGTVRLLVIKGPDGWRVAGHELVE
ncbi:MAG TPA: hypothetical protein VIL00_16855 [Pseudonocardiaceae bacterium]